MISAIPILIAWVAGWFWVSAFRRANGESALARRVLDISLALPFGLGSTAVLFFVLLCAGLSPQVAAIMSDGLWLVGGGALWWLCGRGQRAGAGRSEDLRPADFRWAWLGWIGLAVAAAFWIGSFVQTSSAVPQGDWDAWAIWNMRAKFLAADGKWTGAISPELVGRSHPEYPLLWSSVVAKAWSWTGDTAASLAPTLAGALASAGLVSLLLSGLWVMRGAASGLMAALLLMATVSYWQYSAVQYADIPLALFMLAALCCAVLAGSHEWDPGLMALSGALASMAAWTKDEGLVFLASLGVVLLAVARKRALYWAVAALPAVLVIAGFKLFLAPPFAAWSPSHLAEFNRLGPILKAVGFELVQLGSFPAHPVLAVAVCAALLGFRRPLRPIWPVVPVALLGAGYVGAFWVTTSDLNWHLQTAAGRLLLQIMPLVLFCVFLLLRSPVDRAEPVAAGRRKK
jgi:hypothetical protein